MKTYEKFLNPNKFLTTESLQEIYPSSFIKAFPSTLFLKSLDYFENYKENNLISYDVNSKKVNISFDLLMDIIEDDYMYQYLIQNISNKTGYVLNIAYIEDQDLYYKINYSKMEIIEGLNMLKEYLSVKAKMRLSYLNNLVSIKSLQDTYENKMFDVIINDKVVQISSSYLILLLLSNDEEFNKLVKSNEYGLNKKSLIAILINFIQKENLLLKYKLPNEVILKYANFLEENKDNLFDNYEIIEEPYIDNLVDNLANSKLSDLEKFLYCYIEISNSLNITLKEDIDKFLLVLSFVMDSLNIEYKITGSTLDFSCGEYILNIGSVDKETNITSTTIDNSSVGITCISENEVTCEKFNEMYYKIYKRVLLDKRNYIKFQDALSQYQSDFIGSELTKKERIKLFFKAILRNDLKGNDNIKYISKIFDNFFKNDNSMSLDFMIEVNKNHEFNETPITILTVNGEIVKYYMINYKNEEMVRKIDSHELESMLVTGNYYFYSKSFVEILEKSDIYAR